MSANTKQPPPALLITPSLAPVVAVDAEAKALRDQLLMHAGNVTTVTDRLDADDATAVLRALTQFEKEIETAREAVKAPVLKVGREIDALAKDLLADVRAQSTRISRLCGAFEAEERRKSEAARYEAEREAARIAYEASVATLKANREANKSAEDKARATDAIAGKAQEQIAQVKQQAVQLAAPKPADSQLRTTHKYEVTDMAQLYKAQPHLVKLEPNGTAILAVLRANPNIQIPGLRHWTEQSLNLR